MKNHAWWKESIVYQIYPRSFWDSNGDGIGDINGIRQKLDYLAELGVTVLWLCPFYKSPNVDNGYDVSDYDSVQDDFGTLADVEALIAEAHKRNLKIMIDIVVNHTSSEHAWFIESCKGTSNEYSDFYIWRDAREGKEPNNWGSVFSGSAWTYCASRNQYYLHCFAPEQPDLNWRNAKVRAAVYDMMKKWCERGVDGFRLDAIDLIGKTETLPDAPLADGERFGNLWRVAINKADVHAYLHEMHEQVFSKYDVITVAETSGASTEDALQYAGFETGEVNMIFQFELVHASSENGSKWSLRKASLPQIKTILSKWQKNLEGKAWNSLYWENHDQVRCVSKYGNDKMYWKESAKMLAVCLYFQQGTPYVYQGQELGMTNSYFANPADLRDVESINFYHEQVGMHKKDASEVMSVINNVCRDNARTPFHWSAAANAGFTIGTPWIAINQNYEKINAEAQRADEDSILNFYKKIFALRKKHSVIVYGTYELLLPEHGKLYIYTRELDGVKLLIVCNFTDEHTTFDVPKEFINARILISNYQKETLADGTVMPYEGSVYSVVY